MTQPVSETINTFFVQYRQQHYRKGEILIRAGDDPSGIFYLTDGQVKKYLLSKNGDELVINIFKPVSFFPMSWAINNSSNRYFYEAVSDVTLRKAPKDSVVAFIKKEPEVLYDLMSRVYRGIEGMEERMTYLMVGNAYVRLITELIIQQKRFGSAAKSGITVKVAEKDLASQSGLTRETVSREMKKLKEKGLVILGKEGLLITDPDKLAAELV